MGGSVGCASWQFGIQLQNPPAQCLHPSPRSLLQVTPLTPVTGIKSCAPHTGPSPRPSSLCDNIFFPFCLIEENFHLYDAFKHRSLSFWTYNRLPEITLILWSQQISNRKFYGKFWKPKTPCILWSSGKKIVFSVFQKVFWDLKCHGLTTSSSFVLFCYSTSQNGWCLDNFPFSVLCLASVPNLANFGKLESGQVNKMSINK